MPIFNIWNSIALLYTLCVEDIRTDVAAELHLFQFRMIIKWLCDHWYYQSYAPTTVAATWSAESRNTKRITIAIATTVAAGNARTKKIMQEARMAFAQTVVNNLSIARSSHKVLATYRAGNCPEFITMVTVCRQEGIYKSLCFSSLKDQIYKMCGYCEQLRGAFRSIGINVIDIWDHSSLGLGSAQEVDPDLGFSNRELMTYEDIDRIFSF